jgi:hypothetical protein
MLFHLFVSAFLPYVQFTPQEGISPGPPLSQVQVLREKDLLHVTLGDEPFTSLNLSGRIPFLYPVIGPGGVPLTRGYPMEPRPHESRDHPHHQSMWVAHGRVNGVDFWHDPKAKIRLAGKIRIEGPEVAKSIHLPLDWIAPDGSLVMHEKRVLSFGGHARDRWIDVSCTWTAGEDEVVLGDTKEGTFALRLTPELRVEGKHSNGSLVNSEGAKNKDAWGKRARWISSSGLVGGEAYTVTLFDHPSNLRAPTHWHARTYGLIAANPFGLHHFEGAKQNAGNLVIPPGTSIKFQHRVLLSRGMRNKEILARHEPGPRPPIKKPKSDR